jgi:glycosyltransferase involved in cell wall biosynthesis
MKTRPKLSIVMATVNDFDGTYFTIQALRAYQNLQGVEIIVVDNEPDGPHGKRLKSDFEAQKYLANTAGATYIPLHQPKGTAAPRQKAIEEAKGDFVLCLDSHVIFPNVNAIQMLIAYFEKHPLSIDLISGPLLMDNLILFNTHFNPVWRSEMYGTWGVAWEAPDGKPFAVTEVNQKVEYHTLDMKFEKIQPALMPEGIGWSGHETHLLKAGAVVLGRKDTDVFAVPGQGLGCFAFRKNAWPGFNIHFNAFGGEELYIHEKFRQAGGECLCLGFLKWLHRFGRPGGVPYRNTNFDKCRNYVLGHQELGWDVAPVYQHFVVEKTNDGKDKVTQEQWDALIANPENPNLQRRDPMDGVKKMNLDQHYETVKANKSSYFTSHMDLIRAMAAESDTVVDITRYSETSVALLAGQPKRMTTYALGIGDGPVYKALAADSGQCEYSVTSLETMPEQLEIPACDFLFFKTPHSYGKLTNDLSRWAPNVSRCIGLHDTYRNGTRLDDGGEGYVLQIRDFIATNPDWFVMWHNPDQTGMTLLSRQEKDKPKEPIILWPPGKGAGTELKKLLKSLGVNPTPSCSCNSAALWMDKIGPTECEVEFDKIRKLIDENYEKWGWKDKLRMVAGGMAGAFTPGSAVWEMDDKLDPVGSLIRLAIKRARLQEAAKE